MGTEIDRLEVQVEAQATKANNQLDKLVGKLDSLSNSLSHINSSGLSGLSSGISKFAQASSQLSNVKTADFTRLTKNIQSLANLNTQQIYGAASAMRTLSTAINSLGGVSASSMQVAYVAKDISKLGGVNVQIAITNLPLLATAMNNLMATLSKAPSVNRNIIDMTNALANLASQGNRVGSSSNSIVNGLNRTSSAMARTRKSSISLAAAFGKFYASWFLVIRGVNKLWDSIENSMNYVEVLNYFDAAFGQVADSAVSQWEDAGYDSAEAYYNSFSSRAKELTSKMTGFNVNDDGTLTATGNASLGINPTKLMNYQATFAQMSSSMGVASETSLLLSQALTEIGADLASVKNMDFDKVWKDMASGLAGMSRTLDKYGVNIRNVNLQQKLLDLGIEENITNLNQNDKALIRAIILLDSTKYAWGDLADTLEQPANQLRLLESNFANLSRTLGNLFLPVVSNVLPYVNGLVIGLQRLFTWVGNLLGIDLSGITSAVSDSAVDIGELLGETDDLTDSLTAAGNAAKKLKSNLQAFDELNVITTQTDSSSALSGVGLPSGLLDTAFEKSFSEYQKAWDEAFANMENRANEFADKVEEYLQPVRDIIEDFAIGDFFKAGQDTSNLVAGIFNFFADAIDKVDWYAIGENIGDYLAGINWIKVLGSVGHLIWEALKASLELWAGALSTAPIETALISMVAMPKLLKALASTSLITGVSKLAKNVKLITTAFAGNKKSMGTLLTQYPKLGKAVDVARDSFWALKTGISDGKFLTGANLAIENIRNNLSGLQKGVITAVAAFAEFSIISNTFEGLVDGSENVVTGILKIGGAAGTAALAMYTALGPAGLAIAGVTGLVAAVKGINDAFDNIRAEEIGISIKNAMSNPGGTPLSEVSAQFTDAIGKIGDSFSIITEKSAGLSEADTHIRDTWLEIEKIETAMDAGVISVEEGTEELTRLFGELATTASEKFSALEDTLLAAFGENGVLSGVYDRLGISTENTTSTIIQLNDKVEQRIEELTSILSSTDPSNPNYVAYKEELAGLMAQTDELSTSINNYELALSQIDYSDLILPDGSLDSKELQSFLNEVASATKTANTDIQNAVSGIQTSLTDELNLALSLGDVQSVEEIQTKLDALPDALSLLKSDVALKATELTDTVQLDFIERLNGIIEDAKTEWGEKGFWGQTLNGVFGAGTESEYVKEAVDQQVSNIEELSSAIESSLGDLETDSPGWASAAMNALYNQLFDTEYHFNDISGGKTVYSLNEDFNELINSATFGISALAADRGKDAVDGYATGITDNTSIGTEAAKSFTQKVIDMIADTQESHSPSKVTERLGKYAVEGYNLGFSNNTQSTLDTIGKYMKSVKQAFSDFPNILTDIGIHAISGLLNGMSSMESDIYDKADSIADNIAKTIQTALDIHSPSRVMYALGEFTMQGFQLGMENLYGNIQKSIENFGGTLQYEIAPSPQQAYAGVYSSPALQTAEYNSYSYYDSQNNYDTSETNALLRKQNDLLVAILQKPNLGNDDIFNAAREVYKDKAERRYGNSSAFDPVWG